LEASEERKSGKDKTANETPWNRDEYRGRGCQAKKESVGEGESFRSKLRSKHPAVCIGLGTATVDGKKANSCVEKKREEEGKRTLRHPGGGEEMSQERRRKGDFIKKTLWKVGHF